MIPRLRFHIGSVTSLGRVLIAACVMVAAPLQAQDSGLAFLRLGVDGAAVAMGDAQVAGADGAFSTFWNPAGLSRGNTNSVGISHHIWIGDVRTYALAARFRAGSHSALGLSVTAVSSGDIELRSRPGPAEGVFEAQFLSVGASFARRIGPVRGGLTAKYVSEEIFSETAAGYAFDFGAQADFLSGALLVGASIQNVGSMDELNTVATELPTIARAGIEIRPFRIMTVEDSFPLVDFRLAVDLARLLPDDRSQLHVGVGADVFDVLVLRGGVITNDAFRQLTGGVGFRYGSFAFDYALVSFDSGFGGPGHVLTVLYGW